MKITKLYVSGFKNLLNCEIYPGNVHAITGCNGSGKSNLLDVFAFVVGLLSRSEEERRGILLNGDAPNGDWFPESTNRKKLEPFSFSLECVLKISGGEWLVAYSLALSINGIKEDAYPRVDGARFASESLTAKPLGAVGKAKTLLLRNSSGGVGVFGGVSKRSRQVFKCKNDISALHALEVREADDFPVKYPVLAAFRKSLLSTELVRLDSEAFRDSLYTSVREPFSEKVPGSVINAFDPYYLLKEIEKNKDDWMDFEHWLKRLVDLDGLLLHENKAKRATKNTPPEPQRRFIFARRHERLLSYGQLSMGATVAIGFLTVLYTLLKRGGAALFEEPENYLHPHAVVELIRLFREFSGEHTVIFSTHSTVALNSLLPEEVTVMVPLANGFSSTKRVSEIKEAVDALNRGYVSFGDLLQTNFATRS